MRVLVVDDDRLARAMMANILREVSLDVAEAADAAEALSLLPSCEVAVVDMVLPNPPGLALLTETARWDVAAMVVTGSTTP